MSLRIVVGESLVHDYAGTSHLMDLHTDDKLLVQGDSNVHVIRGLGGVMGILSGTIDGLLGDNGQMRSWGPELESCLARPVSAWLDALEGRFIVVRFAGSGQCEVTCDRFGQAELYYQRQPHGAVIATDLSLLPVSRGAVEYDQISIAHTLYIYGQRPAKRHTLYRDVGRLGVRQYMSISDGEIEIKEVPFAPRSTGDFGDRELQEYADLLLEAVEMRSSRHGNVVYLSSGWDSTALLACLVKIHGSRNVRAVIGRMLYAERSGVINQFELDRAQAVADYFGVKLEIAEFDYWQRDGEFVEALQPQMQSQMLSSMTFYNHVLLAEHVARTTNGDEAVFAGEISDGVHNLGFSQFVTIFHPVLEFREYSDKMASYLFGPTFMGLMESGNFQDDPIYGLLRGRLPDAHFDPPAQTEEGRRRQLLSSFFLRSNRIPLWSMANTKILTVSGRSEYAMNLEEEYIANAAREVGRDTLYSWYLHLYNSFHWQSSTVSTLALTAEARGLPMALPFWDGRLQEFLSAMPESWGRGLELRPTKYPLKWMLANSIDYPLHLQVGPHSYLYDVQPDFSHAAEFLYGSGLVPFIKATLEKRAYRDLLSEQMFDLAYLDGTVTRYLQGDEATGAERSDLFALTLMSLSGWY